MAKIKIEVEVSKESYEVFKLLGDVVAGLAAKKPIAQLAAEELPALAAAVDGIQNAPQEFKDDLAASLKSAMLPVSDAVASLLAPKQSAPAPQA